MGNNQKYMTWKQKCTLLLEILMRKSKEGRTEGKTGCWPKCTVYMKYEKGIQNFTLKPEMKIPLGRYTQIRV